MPQSLTDILIVVAAVFLLWLVIRLFRKPIRWILKLLLNTAIGFAALFALNFFGSAVGITLGLNWINALVIGVAGFPGLVLLLLLKYLFYPTWGRGDPKTPAPPVFQKPRSLSPPRRRKEVRSFSSATCAAKKIPLRL